MVGYCRTTDEVSHVQFDGLTMRACLSLVRQAAGGGRLQRIIQLTPLALWLEFYAGRTVPVVLSAEAGAACLFVASDEPGAALDPTPFCSLLRRHLVGARLADASQLGWDRVAHLVLLGRDELGDPASWTLVLETMGKHSNLICLRPDGRILDAAKRIGRARSRARQVLPGQPYGPPPGQDKLAPDRLTGDELLAGWPAAGGAPDQRLLASHLTAGVSGFGPVRARTVAEAALASVQGEDAAALAAALAGAVREQARLAEAGGAEAAEVEASFRRWRSQDAAPGNGAPASAGPGHPQEQKAWLRAVASELQRAQKRLGATQQRIQGLPPAEAFREQADLIFTHLRDIRERSALARAAGHSEVVVELPGEDAGPGPRPSVTVTLAATGDPAAAAVRLYEEYSQHKRLHARLSQLAETCRQQAGRLEALALQLARDLSPPELDKVRSDALAAGIKLAATPALPRPGPAGRRAAPQGLAPPQESGLPRRFRSPGGYEVWVGRNHQQNQALLRLGGPHDIWLHARGVPGAHVLLRRSAPSAGEDEAAAREIEWAAGVAAYFSQARGSATVAVDWCPAVQVRKAKGAPPGLVVYTGERTVHVAPFLPPAG